MVAREPGLSDVTVDTSKLLDVPELLAQPYNVSLYLMRALEPAYDCKKDPWLSGLGSNACGGDLVLQRAPGSNGEVTYPTSWPADLQPAELKPFFHEGTIRSKLLSSGKDTAAAAAVTPRTTATPFTFEEARSILMEEWPKISQGDSTNYSSVTNALIEQLMPKLPAVAGEASPAATLPASSTAAKSTNRVVPDEIYNVFQRIIRDSDQTT